MTRKLSRAEPAHVIGVSSEGLRSPIASDGIARLARLVLKAERVPRAMLSITLLSRRDMAALNRKHLKHSGPTDVITFAMGRDPGGVLVGDIYICPDVAREQAGENNVGVREELARLVVHGTLHACGHEHPEHEGRLASSMWRRQEQLLKRYWPPASARA